MGTISKTVQYRMERFRKKQMRVDELTQPGWGDPAYYFWERDVKYGTAKFNVPAVMKHQIDTTAATPSPTIFGEVIQTLQIVRGQSQMLAVTSRPGSRQMRLGLEKPQLLEFILVFSPDAGPYLTPIQDAKPVEPISFHLCISNL